MKEGFKYLKNTLVYGFMSEKMFRLVKKSEIKAFSDVTSRLPFACCDNLAAIFLSIFGLFRHSVWPRN